jgi:RecB family exonuclease
MLKSYSYSSLDTFRKCPQQFKFRYLDKIPVPKKVSADQYLGNTVHRVLQQLYKQGANGVLIPLDKAKQLYMSEWEKVNTDSIAVVSNYLGIDDYIRLGDEMLVRHYEKYQPFNQGTLLGTEVNLTFTLPGTAFKLRAIIDKFWKREDGTIEIADFKTGQHLVRAQDDAFYYQMGLYQVAVQSSYPMLEKIELAQYFLRMDEVVSRSLSPEEVDQVTEDFKNAIIATLTAERMDDFPTQEGPLCSYCDYYHLCPAKRHAKMLEEGEAEDGEGKSLPQQAYEKTTEYLEKYRQQKILKGELDVLKKELVALCDEMKVNKLRAQNGHLSVKKWREEKFVTKTENEMEFAELSALARRLKLDEYFALDGRSLMKEGYAKQRLSAEVQELLKPFVRERESVRVTAKLTDTGDEGTEDSD